MNFPYAQPAPYQHQPAYGMLQPSYSMPPPMPQQQQQWNAYPPPQHVPQPYYQQVQQMPQPQQHMGDPRAPNLHDPNAFRIYYRQGLIALNCNSKPIINDLTTLANDYALRMAGIIAEELEAHIRNVSMFSGSRSSVIPLQYRDS